MGSVWMPPRFSVIVPAYNVGQLVLDAVKSVLRELESTVEVIVVDDCSERPVREVLDFSDVRLNVVRHETNRGPGASRNTGMSKATGDYVLFVDGDDWLAEGALNRIERRLQELTDPDVLVFDFAIRRPCGLDQLNNLSVPETLYGNTFNLRKRPEGIELPWAAWNKAYRRDYLAQNEFQFPTGLYEDCLFSCMTTCAADSIGVLDEIGLCYRRCRSGSILRTETVGHFDVFRQYAEIFGFLREKPQYQFDSWEDRLEKIMAPYLEVTASKPGRVPDHLKSQFRQLASSKVWRDSERVAEVPCAPRG